MRLFTPWVFFRNSNWIFDTHAGNTIFGFGRVVNVFVWICCSDGVVVSELATLVYASRVVRNNKKKQKHSKRSQIQISFSRYKYPMWLFTWIMFIDSIIFYMILSIKSQLGHCQHVCVSKLIIVKKNMCKWSCVCVWSFLSSIFRCLESPVFLVSSGMLPTTTTSVKPCSFSMTTFNPILHFSSLQLPVASPSSMCKVKLIIIYIHFLSRHLIIWSFHLFLKLLILINDITSFLVY